MDREDEEVQADESGTSPEWYCTDPQTPSPSHMYPSIANLLAHEYINQHEPHVSVEQSHMSSIMYAFSAAFASLVACFSCILSLFSCLHFCLMYCQCHCVGVLLYIFLSSTLSTAFHAYLYRHRSCKICRSALYPSMVLAAYCVLPTYIYVLQSHIRYTMTLISL